MSAKKVYTLGLDQVQFGKASPVGFMPEVMEKIGKVYQDTCKITQDAPDVTEHYEEGANTPFIRSVTKKPAKLSFSVVVEDMETLERLLGGRATAGEWVDGGNLAANLAIRAISKQGQMIEMPNANISASFDWELSDKGVCKIAVEATPQDVATGRAFATVRIDEPLGLDSYIVEFAKEADNSGKAINTIGNKTITAIVPLGEASWITTERSGGRATIKVQANTGVERSAKVSIIAGKASAIVSVAQRGV